MLYLNHGDRKSDENMKPSGTSQVFKVRKVCLRRKQWGTVRQAICYFILFGFVVQLEGRRGGTVKPIKLLLETLFVLLLKVYLLDYL